MRAFALFLAAIVALVSGTKIIESDRHTFVNRQAIADEINVRYSRLLSGISFMLTWF